MTEKEFLYAVAEGRGTEPEVIQHATEKSAKYREADAEKAIIIEKVMNTVTQADAPVSAGQVADVLKISVQAASNCMSRLVKAGKLTRERSDELKGAYVYSAIEE